MSEAQGPDSKRPERGDRTSWPGGWPGTETWTAGAAALAKGVDLYGDALRGQMKQWNQTLQKLGSGSYGPQDAAQDAQETAQRMLSLCTGLTRVWWESLLGCAPGPAAAGDTGESQRRDRAGSNPGPAPAAHTAAAANRDVPSPGPVAAAPEPSRAAPDNPAAAGGPAAGAKPGPPPAARQPRAAAPRSHRPRRHRSAVEAAAAFLREHLAAGERPARELLDLARKAGISETTLRRAKKRIGAMHRRDGFGRQSQILWYLP